MLREQDCPEALGGPPAQGVWARMLREQDYPEALGGPPAQGDWEDALKWWVALVDEVDFSSVCP